MPRCFWEDYLEIKRIPLLLDASMYSAEWDVERSKGVHLMQIVEAMEEERNSVLGLPQTNKNATPEALEAYRFGGFMFEHAIAWHIVEVECLHNPSLVRPGEYFWCHKCNKSFATRDDKDYAKCKDNAHTGIFATPDALRVDTMRLQEWKFTWKSIRRAGADNDFHCSICGGSVLRNRCMKCKVVAVEGPDFDFREHIQDGIWRWPVQTKSYCHLLGLLGADLSAYFVNGDYTTHTPQPTTYELNFTKRELKENWSAIVAHAEKENWI